MIDSIVYADHLSELLVFHRENMDDVIFPAE